MDGHIEVAHAIGKGFLEQVIMLACSETLRVRKSLVHCTICGTVGLKQKPL